MSSTRLLLATFVLGLLAAASVAEPMPRPSAAEIERATAQIQGIYDDKAKKARTPSDRAELAREIFSKKDSTEVPAERYALLTVAFNLASRGDDASLLVGIADGLNASFNVDSSAALADKLPGITGPVNPASWPSTTARINALISEALNKGEFAVAGDLVTALTGLAKRAHDTKVVAAATALRKASAWAAVRAAAMAVLAARRSFWVFPKYSRMAPTFGSISRAANLMEAGAVEAVLLPIAYNTACVSVSRSTGLMLLAAIRLFNLAIGTAAITPLYP